MTSRSAAKWWRPSVPSRRCTSPQASSVSIDTTQAPRSSGDGRAAAVDVLIAALVGRRRGRGPGPRAGRRGGRRPRRASTWPPPTAAWRPPAPCGRAPARPPASPRPARRGSPGGASQACSSPCVSSATGGMANAATGVPSTIASTTAPGRPLGHRAEGEHVGDRHQGPGVGPEPEQRHRVGQPGALDGRLDRRQRGPGIAGDGQVGVGHRGPDTGERLDEQVLRLLGHESGDVDEQRHVRGHAEGAPGGGADAGRVDADPAGDRRCTRRGAGPSPRSWSPGRSRRPPGSGRRRAGPPGARSPASSGPSTTTRRAAAPAAGRARRCG